jgi:hypothetical protein
VHQVEIVIDINLGISVKCMYTDKSFPIENMEGNELQIISPVNQFDIRTLN